MEPQEATATLNTLRRRERFEALPFFRSEQYDFSLVYLGRAERWDVAEGDG
jgi:hypothetical protein